MASKHGSNVTADKPLTRHNSPRGEVIPLSDELHTKQRSTLPTLSQRRPDQHERTGLRHKRCGIDAVVHPCLRASHSDHHCFDVDGPVEHQIIYERCFCPCARFPAQSLFEICSVAARKNFELPRTICPIQSQTQSNVAGIQGARPNHALPWRVATARTPAAT